MTAPPLAAPAATSPTASTDQVAAATAGASAAGASAVAAWQEANQRYLLAAIAVIRDALQRHAARATTGGLQERASIPAAGSGPGAAHEAGQDAAAVSGGLEGGARAAAGAGRHAGPDAEIAGDQGEALRAGRAAAARAMPSPPALERLRALFGLSPFETDVLLLCAAVELDSTVAALCAGPQGDPARAYATFSLALAALPAPHWSALSPYSPLRRWRLLDVGAGTSLTLAPLRIEERVLHYLAGIQQPDERLLALLEVPRPTGNLPPSYRALAQRIATAWSSAARGQTAPVIQLCGDDPTGQRAVAAAVCQALGLNLSVITAESLPSGTSDLWAFIRLWEREAALSTSALLVDCEASDGAETTRASAVARLVERLSGVLLLVTRERQRGVRRPLLTFDVQKPDSGEQRALWHDALGGAAERLNGQIDLLVSQFNLGAHTIQAAGADVFGRAAAEPDADLGHALWDACRVQARPRLDDLAQRIEPAASWIDLVLPEAQRRILREVAMHVRQRTTVYERWGFAGKGSRGLGISALFAGASGTGKTMAAEVLAGELRLDLYRIDLSATVSKYIGETEKNLRRVFDAAEDGGAILLFDEADALFGKRSEVKDSHDRYANIEVGYLLQRMEAYRGLAILTTNLKNSLDTAFLRRIRFVVQFPFPDPAQRAEIWRHIFPAGTPTEGLDVPALARLNVAGGNIRNIALGAAFLAADAGEPVRMSHLLHAAQTEYAKLEKPLTEAETAGWSAR